MRGSILRRCLLSWRRNTLVLMVIAVSLVLILNLHFLRQTVGPSESRGARSDHLVKETVLRASRDSFEITGSHQYGEKERNSLPSRDSRVDESGMQEKDGTQAERYMGREKSSQREEKNDSLGKKVDDYPLAFRKEGHIEKFSDSRLQDVVEVPLSNDPLFANISRLGKKKSLFVALPEETHMAQNQSVFSMNPFINNSFDYELLIDGSRVCSEREKVFLLVIIPSVAGDRRRRDAIRRTWLGVAERDLWAGLRVGVPVRHIFLLGMRKRVDTAGLRAESHQHGDLVLARFVDSYRNLTTKVLVGLQWVQRFCPQAEMVLKVDQDTLINMPVMVGLLRHIRLRAGGNEAAFVLGLRHSYPKPNVRRTGKWGVSKGEYPLQHFPGYMYGHTYAISAPGGVQRLLNAARHVQLIAPEDAYITGVLPKVTGMVRLTSRAFTVCCRRHISRCEVVWNQRAAITGLDSEGLIDSLWADIMRHDCDPRLSFKIEKRTQCLNGSDTSHRIR